MDLKSVVELCCNIRAARLDEAFVALWLECRAAADIVDRARAVRLDDADHQAYRAAATQALDGDPASARDVLAEAGRRSPLALLAAIDSRLYQQTARYFKPARIAVAGTEYWLVPRLRRAIAEPRHWRADEALDFFTPHFSVILCRLPVAAMLQAPQIAYLALADGHAHGVQRIEEVVAAGELRVVLAMFRDGVGFDPPPAGNWRARGLQDPPQRWEGIRQGIEAHARTADVMVFPELTVTEAHRVELMNWLRRGEHSLGWVVAGSFHVHENGKCFNRSCLLDAIGNVVVQWDKVLGVKLNDAGHEVREDIDRPAEVRLLGTPLGIVGNPICRDFGEEADKVKLPWQQIPVDFLLVPSMGDEATVSAHVRAARTLRRAGTVSVVANQDLACKGAFPGFVCAPGHEPNPAPDKVNCVLTIQLDKGLE